MKLYLLFYFLFFSLFVNAQPLPDTLVKTICAPATNGQSPEEKCQKSAPKGYVVMKGDVLGDCDLKGKSGSSIECTFGIADSGDTGDDEEENVVTALPVKTAYLQCDTSEGPSCNWVKNREVDTCVTKPDSDRCFFECEVIPRPDEFDIGGERIKRIRKCPGKKDEPAKTFANNCTLTYVKPHTNKCSAEGGPTCDDLKDVSEPTMVCMKDMQDGCVKTYSTTKPDKSGVYSIEEGFICPKDNYTKYTELVNGKPRASRKGASYTKKCIDKNTE